MPRAKRGFKRRRHVKKVLKQAKGYHASRHRLIRTAMEAVDHALRYAYVGRRLKKRDMRGLWQTRIAAASKGAGISYSRLIGALRRKGVALDRKILAELAASRPDDFRAIAEWAKAA